MLFSFIHFHIFSTINETYIIIIFKIKYNLVILFFYDLNISFKVLIEAKEKENSYIFKSCLLCFGLRVISGLQ